jgi:hypothetical protein
MKSLTPKPASAQVVPNFSGNGKVKMKGDITEVRHQDTNRIGTGSRAMAAAGSEKKGHSHGVPGVGHPEARLAGASCATPSLPRPSHRFLLYFFNDVPGGNFLDVTCQKYRDTGFQNIFGTCTPRVFFKVTHGET